MRTAPGGRRDIAPADRSWFDRVCRAQARVGCRGRPDLWDDAEAEARVRAWAAYAAGKGPGAVALAARSAAWTFFRSERCVMRGTGRQRAEPGGRASLCAERLTVAGPDGRERDNPALLAAGRVHPAAEEAALARLTAEALGAILAALPAREAALVRRLAGGESQAQLAAEAGVTPQAVGKAYRRARGRLRDDPEAREWL